MFTKLGIIFAILVLFVQHFESRSTVHRSAEERGKKVHCFNPDKPHDMPDDVYEKYKISSKNLSEQGKKDFWSKFVGWWKNIFAQVGKFFEKVGNFFKSLFSKQKPNETTKAPTTEPPPTPNPGQMRKDKNKLVCVEYEKDSNNVITTRVYEVDVTTELTTEVEKLVTTLTTNRPIATEGATEGVTEAQPTTQESTAVPESTPFDPNNDHKENVPVIIGQDNKVKKEEITDATIVKDV